MESRVCSFAQSPTSPAVDGQAMETVERFIEHEMADNGLPALSIALVDDQRLVWGNVPFNRLAEVMTSYSWARQRP